MASDNMKMKISIDGDNRGFKKALNQTSRDMKQFEQKGGGGGLGFGDLLLAQTAGPKMAAAIKAMSGFTHAPMRMGQAKMAKQLAARNNMAEASSIFHKQGMRKESLLMHAGAMNMSRAREKTIGRTATANKYGDKALFGVTNLLKGAAIGAAIAAAALVAITKLSADGKKQLSDSTRFSAGTSVAKAQKEQRDIMRQLDMANNPMLQDQQQRLIRAQEASANQSATGLGYTATELQIDLLDFWALLKKYAAGGMGADDITTQGVVY